MNAARRGHPGRRGSTPAVSQAAGVGYCAAVSVLLHAAGALALGLFGASQPPDDPWLAFRQGDSAVTIPLVVVQAPQRPAATPAPEPPAQRTGAPAAGGAPSPPAQPPAPGDPAPAPADAPRRSAKAPEFGVTAALDQAAADAAERTAELASVLAERTVSAARYAARSAAALREATRSPTRRERPSATAKPSGPPHEARDGERAPAAKAEPPDASALPEPVADGQSLQADSEALEPVETGAPPTPDRSEALPSSVAGAVRVAEPKAPVAPRYPPASARRGHEGLVVVEAQVGADGTVSRARVAESSSHERLDRAALEAVLAAEFTPATQGGAPVPCTVRVPVRFALR